MKQNEIQYTKNKTKLELDGFERKVHIYHTGSQYETIKGENMSEKPNKIARTYTLEQVTDARLVKLAGTMSIDKGKTISKSEVIDRLVEKQAKLDFGEDA